MSMARTGRDEGDLVAVSRAASVAVRDVWLEERLWMMSPRLYM